MVTLHIGAFRTMKLMLLKPALHYDSVMVFDGDSWEEWGESPNDQIIPSHVMIRNALVPDLLEDFARLIRANKNLLIPMAYRRQRGTLACITPDHDWSETTLVIEDSHAKGFLNRLNIQDDQSIWDQPEWIEYLYRNTEESN